VLFKIKIILKSYQNIPIDEQCLKVSLMLRFRIKMGWAFLIITQKQK